jgi:hypothetical protein
VVPRCREACLADATTRRLLDYYDAFVRDAERDAALRALVPRLDERIERQEKTAVSAAWPSGEERRGYVDRSARTLARLLAGGFAEVQAEAA